MIMFFKRLKEKFCGNVAVDAQKKESVRNINIGYLKDVSESDISIENNFDEMIYSPSWQQVKNYIDKMAENTEEFIILNRKNAANNVKYVQAATIPGGYTFQVGTEKMGKYELVEKECSLDEIVQYFSDFYTNGVVEVNEDFTPVERM